MAKVVVSTTLKDPAWNNTTVVRDLDGVRALKEGDGGPIQVAGSATLAQALHKAGLSTSGTSWSSRSSSAAASGSSRPTPRTSRSSPCARRGRYANGVQLNVFDAVR